MTPRREDLVTLAREAAAGVHRPSYCSDPADFEPHAWVPEAMRLDFEPPAWVLEAMRLAYGRGAAVAALTEGRRHDDYGPEGRRRDDYGPSSIEMLVRAVVSRGQSAATYAVLAGAARAAVSVTAARADGLVYPGDMIELLRAAIAAARPEGR